MGLDPEALHDGPEPAEEVLAQKGVAEEAAAEAERTKDGWLGRHGAGFELSEKDRELVLVGTVGALAGMGMSALVGLLGR